MAVIPFGIDPEQLRLTLDQIASQANTRGTQTQARNRQASQAARQSTPVGGYTPPEFNPVYPDWYESDLSGIDWGGLGPGYTGAPRAPNSPAPTGRFDWETEGSGLKVSQLSNEEAAKAFQRGVSLYNMPRFDGLGVDPRRPEPSGLANAAFGSLSPAFQGAEIRREGFQSFIQDPTPQQIQAAQASNQGQYYDPQTKRLYVDSGGGAGNTYIDEAMEQTGLSLEQLSQLSPSQSAALFDAVIRGREQKNQRPKRRGPLGTILPLVTGLAFGPLAGGVTGAAFQGAKGNPLGAALSLGLGAFGQSEFGQNALSKVGRAVGEKVGNFFGNGSGNVLASTAKNANAVPGGSTGITTPTGGGIVGSGQLNPAGVGILGNTASSGINLGWSPLAVAGGATAMPGVTGLPTGGKIPGTNQIIGEAPGQAAIPKPPAPGSPDYLKYLASFAPPKIDEAPGELIGGEGSTGTMPTTTSTPEQTAVMTAAGGTGTQDPGFLQQMSRLLGPQAGIGHKTRPGAYFNVLSQVQPRAA